MNDLFNFLKSKAYPGRGIVVFHPKDQNKLFCAYWLMGRSENSRNRVFDLICEGDWRNCGVKTVPADPAKLTDEHLIIYNARISLPEKPIVIITNGDQSDTIANYVHAGNCEKVDFVQALMTRFFEDDAPNFTPRISAMINTDTGEVSFSILKCTNKEDELIERSFIFFESLPQGEGRLMTTYIDDADILEPASSEPVPITCEASDIESFKSALWESLNENNKISLYVEEIDLLIKESHYSFINKYERK